MNAKQELIKLQNEYRKANNALQAWRKTDECQLQYAEESTPEVMTAFENGQNLSEAQTLAATALVNWMFSYIKTPAGKPKGIVERNTLNHLESMYHNDPNKRYKIINGVAELTMLLVL